MRLVLIPILTGLSYAAVTRQSPQQPATLAPSLLTTQTHEGAACQCPPPPQCPVLMCPEVKVQPCPPPKVKVMPCTKRFIVGRGQGAKVLRLGEENMEHNAIRKKHVFQPMRAAGVASLPSHHLKKKKLRPVGGVKKVKTEQEKEKIVDKTVKAIGDALKVKEDKTTDGVPAVKQIIEEEMLGEDEKVARPKPHRRLRPHKKNRKQFGERTLVLDSEDTQTVQKHVKPIIADQMPERTTLSETLETTTPGVVQKILEALKATETVNATTEATTVTADNNEVTEATTVAGNSTVEDSKETTTFTDNTTITAATTTEAVQTSTITAKSTSAADTTMTSDSDSDNSTTTESSTTEVTVTSDDVTTSSDDITTTTAEASTIVLETLHDDPIEDITVHNSNDAFNKAQGVRQFTADKDLTSSIPGFDSIVADVSKPTAEGQPDVVLLGFGHKNATPGVATTRFQPDIKSSGYGTNPAFSPDSVVVDQNKCNDDTMKKILIENMKLDDAIGSKRAIAAHLLADKMLDVSVLCSASEVSFRLVAAHFCHVQAGKISCLAFSN